MLPRCPHVHATTIHRNTNACNSAANTTDVPDNDQSQLNQISAGCSVYSPQPFRAQASSPHHFVPAHDLQQVGTVVIRDPAHHLSDPGPSNQFLYDASHFQLQQQHFSSTSTTPQPPAAATPIPNICHQPLSHRQPAGTNPHYGFRAPYVSQQATQQVGILAILLIGTN